MTAIMSAIKTKTKLILKSIIWSLKLVYNHIENNFRLASIPEFHFDAFIFATICTFKDKE